MSYGSKHFPAREFACRCCGDVRIDPVLLVALEWLRAVIGQPILINSGYRCEKHNAAVGSTPSSQHRTGKAADIRVAGLRPETVAYAATQVPYFRDGGIGTYETFVHVDVRDGSARWRG